MRVRWTLQRGFSYTGATVKVGQRSAQHLGQPSLQSPCLLDRARTADRFQIKVLQNVFGVVEAVRSATDEAQEFAMSLSERDDHRVFIRARIRRISLHATSLSDALR